MVKVGNHIYNISFLEEFIYQEITLPERADLYPSYTPKIFNFILLLLVYEKYQILFLGE